MLGFVCLIAWAFSWRRRDSFSEAARLPLEDSARAEMAETTETDSQSERQLDRCLRRLSNQ